MSTLLACNIYSLSDLRERQEFLLETGDELRGRDGGAVELTMVVAVFCGICEHLAATSMNAFLRRHDDDLEVSWFTARNAL